MLVNIKNSDLALQHVHDGPTNVSEQEAINQLKQVLENMIVPHVVQGSHP